MTYQGNQRRDDREGNPSRSFARTPDYTQAELEAIIHGSEETSAQTLVEIARRIGEQLADMKFSTSQIRNIFGIVRAIEQRAAEGTDERLDPAAYRDLMLLKPKLAYQYGRASNTGRERKKDAMKLLQDVLSSGIDLVEHDLTRFTHFVEFFEAILAYHRAAEGNKK